jgi:hypothetical protein
MEPLDERMRVQLVNQATREEDAQVLMPVLHHRQDGNVNEVATLLLQLARHK